MSIVRRLLSRSRPATQADRDLAAGLGRLADLRRAGILSAEESRVVRARLLADAPRHPVADAA